MLTAPIQVTFRGLSPSKALRSLIQEKVSRLQRFSGEILRCLVVVEMPHRHHRKGRSFHVRLEVTGPGGARVVVSHQPTLHKQLKDEEAAAHRKQAEIDGADQDVRVALHEAFDVARRQLEALGGGPS